MSVTNHPDVQFGLLARPEAEAPSSLVDIYARRALERGVDPRFPACEFRAQRWGTSERLLAARSSGVEPGCIPAGRGTHEHQAKMSGGQPTPVRPVESSVFQRWRSRVARPGVPLAARRLVTAGFVVLACGGQLAPPAGAETANFQTRYVVQEGDTLWNIASEFGVDPQSIAAASGLVNPEELSPRQTIVIPAVGQTPEEAAIESASLQGFAPYVLGGHTIQPGETLGTIAGESGIDATFIAEFNQVSDIDNLQPGERLLIPAAIDIPGLPGSGNSDVDQDQDSSRTEATAVNSEGEDISTSAWPVNPAIGPGPGQVMFPASGVGGLVDDIDTGEWDAPGADSIADPASGSGTFIPGIQGYQQRYNLSCEYAAAHIATAAFGTGIDEDTFLWSTPQSSNPHWGFRGDINGAWGNDQDYGIYPEALAPTLEANGFTADVFYAGDDAGSLIARLDSGMPTMVWLGFYGDTAERFSDQGDYAVAPGTHVLTAYGYDDTGVYLADPGTGGLTFLTWGDFMTKWSVLDGMALGVAPA